MTEQTETNPTAQIKDALSRISQERTLDEEEAKAAIDRSLRSIDREGRVITVDKRKALYEMSAQEITVGRSKAAGVAALSFLIIETQGVLDKLIPAGLYYSLIISALSVFTGGSAALGVGAFVAFGGYGAIRALPEAVQVSRENYKKFSPGNLLTLENR
ncbi:MAG: hypothetical protein PHE27_03950 [Alphaproteobacteria bacterium]|nr:hypothetical protein [Alphaproteobacteria bacterium]